MPTNWHTQAIRTFQHSVPFKREPQTPAGAALRILSIDSTIYSSQASASSSVRIFIALQAFFHFVKPYTDEHLGVGCSGTVVPVQGFIKPRFAESIRRYASNEKLPMQCGAPSSAQWRNRCRPASRRIPPQQIIRPASGHCLHAATVCRKSIKFHQGMQIKSIRRAALAARLRRSRMLHVWR